jgi:hypothetical protein
MRASVVAHVRGWPTRSRVRLESVRSLLTGASGRVRGCSCC